jgi:GR25 family glycosyltransferase involved in LPS biosynthesis
MTINEYFDSVVCINLTRRPDRWAHCVAQFNKHGIKAERFVGADTLTWGNHGCTLSHRIVHELIIKKEWKRTLILEDDFDCRHDNTQELFSGMIKEVPDDWDILYLGGHYSEPPKKRISPHVIQCGTMKTTSSVAVTLEQAKKMAPTLIGCGPIDEWYSMWCRKSNSYIFQPRLMVQYNNYSDLQQHDCNNEPCMTDSRHEEMV